jgi:hypothetical protein
MTPMQTNGMIEDRGDGPDGAAWASVENSVEIMRIKGVAGPLRRGRRKTGAED